MSLKKIIILAVAAVFLATPAYADNIPEYEGLCDWQNIFAETTPLTYGVVTANNIAEGLRINQYSFFPPTGPLGEIPGESFKPPLQAASRVDACFGDYQGYRSYRLQPQFPGTYEWRLKLQMHPESDINVNIYDCVLKPQGTDIFSEAQQTGRVNWPDGSTRFVRSLNPSITVVAEPGDWNPVLRTGRFDPFVMTARRLPNLGRVALDQLLYTSKAHWYEGLVLELPIEGNNNGNGDTQHMLIAGDFLRITVSVPFGHPAYISYGPDNVLLKYIGIVGSEIVWRSFLDPRICERDFLDG